MKAKKICALIATLLMLVMLPVNMPEARADKYVGMFPFAESNAFDGLNEKQISEITKRAEKALNNFSKSFSIEDMNINKNHMNSVYNVVYRLREEIPEYFYVDSRLNCTTSGDNIKDVLVFYIDNKEKTIEKMSGIVREAAEIISLMYESGAKTEFEKALWLHDFIITNCEYDPSFNKHGLDNMMLEKTAVCQGYTNTYKYLLRLAGVESVNVYNNTEKHEWSRVKIDGKWYNVDMTYDDPSYDYIHDRLGRVAHTYFLLTDDEISQYHKHTQKYCASGVTCTDTKYSGAPFKAAETSVLFIGNYGYYATSSRDIVKCDKNMNTVNQSYYHVDTYWLTRDNPKAFFDDYFGGLGTYNGALYFNTGNTLVRLDVSGSEPNAQTILEYKPSSSYFPTGIYLFGSYVRGSTMYYAEANYVDSIDENGNKKAGFFGTDNSRIMTLDLSKQ